MHLQSSRHCDNHNDSHESQSDNDSHNDNLNQSISMNITITIGMTSYLQLPPDYDHARPLGSRSGMPHMFTVGQKVKCIQ